MCKGFAALKGYNNAYALGTARSPNKAATDYVGSQETDSCTLEVQFTNTQLHMLVHMTVFRGKIRT